jgi:hypothetical protein
MGKLRTRLVISQGFVGTVHYMAPEVFAVRHCGPTSFQFASLYRCVCTEPSLLASGCIRSES